MKKEETMEMVANEEIVEASIEIYEAMSKRMEEMGLGIKDALQTMAGAVLIMIDNVASFTGINKDTLQMFIGSLIAESTVKTKSGKDEKGKKGGKG